VSLGPAGVRAIIDKKRRGGTLERDEIEALVNGYVSGEIDDAPMAAWLMAVCLTGMTLDETAHLTRAMAMSGDTIDWAGAAGPIVDKHSTGGVGDAVTLVAVPLAAACGAKVAKLSGRALGHTGGTIDKLECIPGLRTELSIHEFRAQVMRVGCAIAAATARLAPADKMMYALRDRTATVASVPLIAASVLSKKVAGGAPAIVLDVKVGAGAFMRTLDEGRALAETMIAVGSRLDRRVRVLLTAMDEPLADSIGDALELEEALRTLEGRCNGRLADVAASVAGAMLQVAGLRGIRGPADALRSGAALRSFSEMVAAQNGRLADFDRRFSPSSEVRARADGYVERIDAGALGEIVARAKDTGSESDARRLGLRLAKRVGDAVSRGETLAACFGALDPKDVAEALVIGPQRAEPRPLVLATL